MRTLFAILFPLLVLPHPASSQAVLTIGSTTVVTDTIITGIDVPWEILYGPDNHIWMTERKGIVSRIDAVAKTKTTILDISASVNQYGEGGLLGMVLHPDFVTTKEVFLAYTYTTGNGSQFEKLVKYNWSGVALANEQIIIDSIRAGLNHNGSRLCFMPDKTLLMTTGESGYGPLAQDLNSKNGKVLRVSTDGSIPADNPFAGSYVYSYGHRNPQGLVLAPGGKIYISEHGTAIGDEFQLLEKGRNYGWPDVEGYCDLPAEQSFCTTNNVKEPLVDWSPSIAPSDLIFYRNSNFPEFHDRFIMTTLKEKKLVAIKLDVLGTSSVSQVSYLATMFGRLRDICVGPQQEIYLATNGPESFNTNPNTHSLLVLRPAPDPFVGLTDHNTDFGIFVFPNPANESIIIKTGINSSAARIIKLNDICGKLCREEKISGETHVTNTNDLENGIYFLSLTESGKIVYQNKLVISR